jgi:flagellar basal-body rod protein FlgB
MGGVFGKIIQDVTTHLRKSPTESMFPVKDDPFSRIGNDTNTVDIDREMMKLNQNQLLFDASAEIIQTKLQELKDVIGGIR